MNAAIPPMPLNESVAPPANDDLIRMPLKPGSKSPAGTATAEASEELWYWSPRTEKSTLPDTDWGSLPVEGGIEVAYKQDLADSDEPDALLEEIRERLDRVRSPHRSAEFFEIEEIIDPRDSRRVLCEWIELAQRSLAPGPSAFSYRP